MSTEEMAADTAEPADAFLDAKRVVDAWNRGIGDDWDNVRFVSLADAGELSDIAQGAVSSGEISVYAASLVERPYEGPATGRQGSKTTVIRERSQIKPLSQMGPIDKPSGESWLIVKSTSPCEPSIVCLECDTRGRLPCPDHCEAGRVRFDQKVALDCWDCSDGFVYSSDGESRRPCPACNGSRRVTTIEQRWRDCKKCESKGTVKCPHCDWGQRTCPKCAGSAWIATGTELSWEGARTTHVAWREGLGSEPAWASGPGSDLASASRPVLTHWSKVVRTDAELRQALVTFGFTQRLDADGVLPATPAERGNYLAVLDRGRAATVAVTVRVGSWEGRVVGTRDGRWTASQAQRPVDPERWASHNAPAERRIALENDQKDWRALMEIAGVVLAIVGLWTFGSLVGGGLDTMTPVVFIQLVLFWGSLVCVVFFWFRSWRLNSRIRRAGPKPREPLLPYEHLPEAVRVR